jgi:hypothetical protein
MAWTSKYNAGFTKPLIRQLLSIIQRDQRAALDFVGGAGVLPDIVSYQLAPKSMPNYPALFIAPLSIDFRRDSDAGALPNAVFLECVVTVASAVDDPIVIELLEDYVRALDAIFNTLQANTLADVYTSRNVTIESLGTITAPALDPGTLKDLFVMAHQYDRLQWMDNQFIVTAGIKLQIDREET